MGLDTEDGITAAQENQENSLTIGIADSVGMVLDATGGMEAIEQGINRFIEGSQVLMNALDEVAKLHPFIGGKPGMAATYY